MYGVGEDDLVPAPYDRRVPSIRSARPTDAATIEAIENDADQLLVERLRPGSWPPGASGTDRLAHPGFLLVVALDDGDVVGFAHVVEMDGLCHLEQLSVRPEHSRRGLGRRLVTAAVDHARLLGHERITLRTYADVPWNAPFYRSVGFVEEEPVTTFHRSLVEIEHRLGLDRYGRRVQMAATLT
jgi:GNAT superfamily N-acetyltransferase